LARQPRQPEPRQPEPRQPEPQLFVVENDGLRVAALDWGGNGPAILFLHPNGFCAGLFHPIATRLRDRFRPIGVDLRAHGGTDEPPTVEGYAFERMAADVLAVLDALDLQSVVIVGESLGGGVAVTVDRIRPGFVRRVLLCEAVAFSVGATRPVGEGPGDGGNFMAAIARKRRAVWPDRETMIRSYGSRPPLDELAPEALEAYVRWGTIDRPDGQVELACRPEAEATIFESSADENGARAAWTHLASLHAEATVVAGSRSNLPREWFVAQAERAGCPSLELEGGHFFMQENTERAVPLVVDWLAE
jgi:pimeloyl-ACP methyl ester carboxylesterase